MNKLIKNILTSIALSMIFVICGDLAAYLISNYKGWNIQDVMFVIGISIISLAALSMVGGNSTGLSLQGLGLLDAQYTANLNLEITKKERELTNYHDSIKNHINFKATFSGLTLILGGMFIILSSVLI